VSAVTALILIGNSHPHDGGMRAFAEIILEEGERPTFKLRWIRPLKKSSSTQFRNFTMIPTLENMLDDALLIIVYALCRNTKIFKKINLITKGAPVYTHRLSMYEDFTKEERLELYADIKEISDFPKVTWCLFEGTGIANSIQNLTYYLLESEVTRSAYLRTYDQLSSEWKVYGRL